jgi:hypothetical protein
MFAEGDRVALNLELLPERNNTRTWKRKDGKKEPRLSKDIYRSSTPHTRKHKIEISMNVIRDERTTTTSPIDNVHAFSVHRW